jgi:hypothetical protein
MVIATGTNATASDASSFSHPANHPGIINLSTGTTSTGRVNLRSGTSSSTSTPVLLGGGQISFCSIIYFNTNLSDGTNRFHAHGGLMNSQLSATEGVYYRYRDDENGGKWQFVTRAADTPTVVDSGITVAADTWYRLEAVINAGATSVEFFVNGTSVGTSTTNIPTAYLALIPAGINKELGSTARTLYVDAYWYEMLFTTAR